MRRQAKEKIIEGKSIAIEEIYNTNNRGSVHEAIAHSAKINHFILVNSRSIIKNRRDQIIIEEDEIGNKRWADSPIRDSLTTANAKKNHRKKKQIVHQ